MSLQLAQTADSSNKGVLSNGLITTTLNKNINN